MFQKLPHISPSFWIKLCFVLIFGLHNSVNAQNYVDISVDEKCVTFNTGQCNSIQGYQTSTLIDNVAEDGIGWGANFYLQNEVGNSNLIYDLTWVVKKNTSSPDGASFEYKNVDIWMYEYDASQTQFQNNQRPEVEKWTTIANTPSGISNVVKVFSNKSIVIKNPSVDQKLFTVILDNSYNYSGSKNLIIYIQNISNKITSGVSYYTTYKHNAGCGRRRICNWSGTVSNPLSSTANNTLEGRYARVMFNKSASGKDVIDCTNGSIIPSDCQTISITPSATTVCKSGSDITFTKNPTNTTGTFSSTTGLTIDATTGTINSASSIQGTYNVTFTESASCKFTKSITINPKLVIASVTESICSGVAFNVTPIANASNTNVIPPGTKYTWTVPTPLTSGATSQNTPQNSISQTLTNTTNAPISIVYKVKAISGTSPNECTTDFDLTVTVNPTPTFTSSATTACPNAKVKYATTAGKLPYVWTIPGISGTDYTIVSGGTATSDTLIIKWLTEGDKVVKVGYTENSCVSPTPASITTKVSGLLTGVFIAQPSTNSCQNVPIIYAADKNYTSFNWQITGVLNTDYEIVAGGKATDDTLIIKWKTLGNHTVELDYTASAGCATTTSAKNTTKVVANTYTPIFASSDVTQPTCKDTTGSVKFKNLPNAGKWNVKAIHSTNSALTKDTTEKLLNSPFTLIFDSLYPGSYTFQITDTNGCVSPVLSAITIDPQPISPAKPVLDVNTIYCASNSYNTFSLDKIVFNPKPNSTETVKYLDENNNTILGQTIVDSTKKYKFLFDNGVCTSKDTLVTIIPFDEGPLNVPAVLDISSTLICAVDKQDFNSLFTKIPASLTSGFTFFISKDPSGNPIIPNTTYLPTNGGLLDSIYYTLANQNGCKNVKFGKLKFINNVGPTGLSLNLNGKQLFCGFSNPTVAKLDTVTAILSKTNPSNSLVWYASETATTPLPGNTPLFNGFYFAAEKPTTGCESFVRKKIEAIIQVFGPTILNTANQSFCKNSTLTISDLSISPYLYPDFVWLDAYKVPQLPTTKLIPGKYFAAEKFNGCISDKSQEIEVKFESPIITIAPTKLPTCGVGNGALKVVGGVTGYTYKWSKNGTPMTDIGDQISNLPTDYTIKYSVIVEDTKGCKAYDTTQFTDCEPPGIPHVLTLYKDGKNDVFKLYYHTKYPNCKLSIFNRWGAMVYESKDIPYKDDWDGKPNVSGTLGSGELPTGTYFYLIDKGDGSALESGYIELVK